MALVALTLRLQASGARPYEVALLLAAGLVPFVLLARVAGRVADSADSRRVLVCATVAQAACCIPLIFTGNAVVMTTLVALLGAGAAFSQATWQALIPRVVGEDNIAAATAAQQSTFTIATIVAPAVAGLLSGAFGTGLPLAIDAVTFGVLTVAAAAVRTRRAGICRGRRETGPGRLGGAARRPHPRPAGDQSRGVRTARGHGERRDGLPGPADAARGRRMVWPRRGNLDAGRGRRRSPRRGSRPTPGAPGPRSPVPR